MNKQGNRLKKCEICGSLMSDILNNPVCAKCLDIDTDLFEKAKAKLKYGEKVTVENLSQRSGVESQHIRRWVKTGRLRIDSE